MNKKSILIVEDEAIVSLDLSMLLEKAGYDINRICSSSDDLFNDFEKYPRPDLILMDINIKGLLDGLDSSLKIKELYDIPVIFLTAYADKSTLEKAKNSYPYGYIIKPYDKRRLLVIIEMALNMIHLEEKLKEREALFVSTFDSIDDSVIICDKENIIKYINPAAVKLVGPGELTGRLFDDVFKINYSLNGKRGEFTDTEGNLRTLEINQTYLQGNIGNKGTSVRILTDITLQLYLEAQLRESHKMEAVGRLAGGVAHDFNNLLTVIMGYCSLILDNENLMQCEPTLENDIKGIQTTSKKAVKLTKQLLTFSENQVHNPRNIDLNSIIIDLERILERMVPESVSLDISLTPSEAIISIDPVQMEQILINLVVNSRDAIQEKGKIKVSTEIVKNAREIYLRSGKLPPGEYVKISVEDSGTGIPAEIQSMIFEPFFSTKGGKGSGLGLSTVYGIIQNSGGFIDLKSSAGQGTLFELYFKRLESVVTGNKPSMKSSIDDLGNESILVVEEDEFVRSIMVRILRNKKYNVTDTGYAGEAILIAEKRNPPFDLLITDLYMPNISGEELSRRITAFSPSMKTMFTSTAHKSNSQLSYFIQKPFDPDDFSGLIRNCLDSN
ncbi:ATP-binding response regulator [Spirochaeta isovalerica]|uniref:histidine kinase n=1 Tax=Spirochaeta isovalerica TaxID=150 RepID=A0A841R8E8_9SPIO|nr:response regulator [Spirochaeta isovalerica]MBB6479008.1 signal transduction histidine kinase/DNA-binding response OmpR family regulator [Spirochaeta isovalerica]